MIRRNIELSRRFVENCIDKIGRGIVLLEFKVDGVWFDAIIVKADSRQVLEGDAAKGYDLNGKEVYVLEFEKGSRLRHLKECFGEIVKLPLLLKQYREVKIKGFYCVLEDINAEYKALVERYLQRLLNTDFEVKVLTRDELAELFK